MTGCLTFPECNRQLDGLGGTVTLEGLEALQRNPGRARNKLQQPGSALLVKRLHCLPEPLDYVAVRGAVLETRVGLPIIDVDFAQATHDELHGQERSRRVKARRADGGKILSLHFLPPAPSRRRP